MIPPDFHHTPQSSAVPSNLATDLITDLLHSHAKNLIAQALEAEVKNILAQLNSQNTAVVRNGYLPTRSITTATGAMEVKVPSIRARDGEAVNFTSTLIPKYLRRSKSISAWAAYAYLKGVSERDMALVLEVVLGEGAKKLTPLVVSQLKKSWTREFETWKRRDLSTTRFSYIYAMESTKRFAVITQRSACW